MSLTDLEASVAQCEEDAQLLEEFHDKLLEALLVETRIGSRVAYGNLGKMVAHVKECRDIARLGARQGREQYALFAAHYTEIKTIGEPGERKKA